MHPQERISQARQLLQHWRGMALMSERPHELARLLRSESRSLARLAIEYPENALTAVRLIAALEETADRVESEQSTRKRDLAHA